MRRRLYPKTESAAPAAVRDLTFLPGGGPVVEVRRLEGAARLVSLEDPAAHSEEAEDAFVRLRPPEGTPADVTAAWRESVARVARAVRVVAAARGDVVPIQSDRSDGTEDVGTVREEAERLAAETGDEGIERCVRAILDEVGA